MKAVSLLKNVRQKLVKTEKERDDMARELQAIKAKEEKIREKEQSERFEWESKIEQLRNDKEREVKAMQSHHEKEIASFQTQLDREIHTQKAQFELELATCKVLLKLLLYL